VTLRLTVDVNNSWIAEVRIRNQGHPVTRDNPPDDDLRQYSVCVEEPGRRVDTYVQHRRSEGWQALVIRSLQAVANHQPNDHNPKGTP